MPDLVAMTIPELRAAAVALRDRVVAAFDTTPLPTPETLLYLRSLREQARHIEAEIRRRTNHDGERTCHV